MATTYYHAPPQDLERATVAYTPIPGGPPREEQPKSKKLLPLILFALFLSLSLILILIAKTDGPDEPRSDLNGVTPATPLIDAPSRGPGQGVSEKVFRQAASTNLSFEWTNVMLTWQRTAFHFQPENNWMNDPNGPLFHKGWYHLFYQYNPDAAVWGNISWGHAVSRDLIHWLHLPFAMVPDQSYDVNGVWTGSATILPDGRIVMLYTGDTAEMVQVQCLSYPADLSDPLLLEWVKDPANPVLVPPPGIGKKDFRDPTTAWLSPNGNGDTWLITIGSKVNKTGIALVYKTRDFVNYELLEEYLHRVPGTGMWECVDFYPVSTTGQNGLDTSVNGPGVKHVLKASLDDDKNDYYAVGTYDPTQNKWTPDNPDIDVGIGLRYDYGKYYASKTFYDQNKKRRILWGWIRETDAEVIDVMKGWSGVQCIPRTIVFDQKTGNDILQWPVEEVKSLRSDSFEFENVKLEPSSIKPLNVKAVSQLDIEATFTIDHKEAAIVNDSDEYNCSTSGGAANRGMLGPFGIVVLAYKDLSEMTPVYFYVSKGLSGNLVTHFCVDELRSSKAFEVQKIVYGSTVPVLDGEKFSIRLLVDHSIVESFAQGGRRVVTSRIYPTRAIGIASRIFLFNNATGISVNASLKIWKMESADIRPFPLNQM